MSPRLCKDLPLSSWLLFQTGLSVISAAGMTGVLCNPPLIAVRGNEEALPINKKDLLQLKRGTQLKGEENSEWQTSGRIAAFQYHRQTFHSWMNVS